VIDSYNRFRSYLPISEIFQIRYTLSCRIRSRISCNLVASLDWSLTWLNVRQGTG